MGWGGWGGSRFVGNGFGGGFTLAVDGACPPGPREPGRATNSSPGVPPGQAPSHLRAGHRQNLRPWFGPPAWSPPPPPPRRTRGMAPSAQTSCRPPASPPLPPSTPGPPTAWDWGCGRRLPGARSAPPCSPPSRSTRPRAGRAPRTYRRRTSPGPPGARSPRCSPRWSRSAAGERPPVAWAIGQIYGALRPFRCRSGPARRRRPRRRGCLILGKHRVGSALPVTALQQVNGAGPAHVATGPARASGRDAHTRRYALADAHDTRRRSNISIGAWGKAGAGATRRSDWYHHGSLGARNMLHARGRQRRVIHSVDPVLRPTRPGHQPIGWYGRTPRRPPLSHAPTPNCLRRRECCMPATTPPSPRCATQPTFDNRNGLSAPAPHSHPSRPQLPRPKSARHRPVPHTATRPARAHTPTKAQAPPAHTAQAPHLGRASPPSPHSVSCIPNRRAGFASAHPPTPQHVQHYQRWPRCPRRVAVP